MYNGVQYAYRATSKFQQEFEIWTAFSTESYSVKLWKNNFAIICTYMHMTVASEVI